MSYSTYFEIGGHVVESHVERPGVAARPSADPIRELARKHSVPVPLARAVVSEVSEKTDYDIHRASRAYGRLRRAKWAATTAATLAMADGPLPIGDALAIGFLAAYGVYETAHAVGDLRQS